MVVVTLGVDPEAVIGDSVLLVTAFVQGLQVTQDICVGDHVSLAAAQDDRGPVPVQQLVDQNAHRLIATDPTAWFPALEIGREAAGLPPLQSLGVITSHSPCTGCCTGPKMVSS